MTYRNQDAPPEMDRSVLLIGLNGRVFGLDRTSGNQRWSNELPGGGYGEVFMTLRYGALIVSATGSRVFRLDYATGQTVWYQDTQASGRATIVVEPDCIVIAKGGYIDAYAHTGQPLWQQPLTGMGLGRISLGFPGNIEQADDAGSK